MVRIMRGTRHGSWPDFLCNKFLIKVNYETSEEPVSALSSDDEQKQMLIYEDVPKRCSH